MRRRLDGKSMDAIAIERLQEFEGEALEKHPNGYWLAFSGGKDSVCILDLAKRADVTFEAHYSVTTVDPPELVQFIRSFPEVQIDRPPLTMWQLIRKKGMPPRRMARYCCQELKEHGGDGRVVVTGVRWGESNRRSKRRMVESCYRSKSGRRFIHPIIDWSTTDVWAYIRERPLRYCRLYDEGWKRLGCVLCPMTRQTEKQIARWPRLARAWERAVKATWNPASARHGFTSADEYWAWWLDRDATGKPDTDPVLFEDDPDMHGDDPPKEDAASA